MMISKRKANNDEGKTTSTSQPLILLPPHALRHENDPINKKNDQTKSTSPTNVIDVEKQCYEPNEVYDSCPINCENSTRSNGIKLLIGVVGIYISYLLYGTLQEEVYTYPQFHYVCAQSRGHVA